MSGTGGDAERHWEIDQIEFPGQPLSDFSAEYLLLPGKLNLTSTVHFYTFAPSTTLPPLDS